LRPDEGGDDGEAEDEADALSVVDIFKFVQSESEIADQDRRPFTVAISLYLEQRLLIRDELTKDLERQSRVVRVADRCRISVGDLLRLLLRRESSLDPALQVLDRLLLASPESSVIYSR
jgi:hypothetical protein